MAKAATKKKPAAKKAAAAENGTAEKYAGLYRVDTPKAKYLEMLSDEKPHTLDELSKFAGGSAVKYPGDAIFYLRKDGADKKLWKLEHDKESKAYTMTLMAAGKKALGTK